MYITETDLSARIKRVCGAAEIKTVDDLRKTFKSGEMSKYRNLGVHSMNEIENFLDSFDSGIDKLELYHKAIDKWGQNAQMEMVVEECSELILSIQKHKRNPSQDSYEKMCDEAADVEIMIEQIRVILGDELIDTRKEYKLDRLKKRLDE